MTPTLYYCYDAYCGWCYGFSPVIKKLFLEYHESIAFETLSGGMIPAENPKPISHIAPYIKDAYKKVESLAGVTFGSDYLWHIENPDLSDWFPHSEKAAIALCVFKDYYPQESVLFAADLQFSLYGEGRDLTDDEAYRHLLEKYEIPVDEFYEKLKSEEYLNKAHEEFSLCRQLQVTGFPALLLQVSDQKFYLIARGYTKYEDVKATLDSILS